MDRELKEQIRPEYSEIFSLVADAVDNADPASSRLEFQVPLSTNFYKFGADIAQALEDYFPNRAAFVVLKVQALPEALDIKVYYPPKYNFDSSGGRWVVAAPDDDCWVFGVSDEQSARNLIQVLNAPPTARFLHFSNPDVGVERAVLRTALFGLRDRGIGLISCRLRSRGVLKNTDFLA